MTRLRIFGDSWSYRSFQKLPDFRETFGTATFQKLFSERGIEAINHSQQGASNKRILETIQQCKFDDNDIVLVFQTDPLRDLVDRKSFKLLCTDVMHQSLNTVAKNSLQNFYQGLATCSQPMVLVGGLSALAHDIVPNHIDRLDQSWTELTAPGFSDCFFEWVEIADLVHHTLQCTDDFTTTRHAIQAKNAVWHTSDYFSWCHPSDLGYDLMFKQICQHLEHKGLL
jgi:hypothetical protein